MLRQVVERIVRGGSIKVVSLMRRWKYVDN